MTGATDSSLIRKLLWEHPAFLASVLYVLASAIGMGFAWAFLGRFGINVFQYSQIGDFLLASLKEPITWGLVAVSLLLVVLDSRASRRWGRKERSVWTRWYGSERYRQAVLLLGPLLIGFYIYVYALYKAELVFDGEARTVTVRVSDGGPVTEVLLLDTTSGFVFLFDPASKRVTILPHESVASISYIAQKK